MSSPRTAEGGTLNFVIKLEGVQEGDVSWGTKNGTATSPDDFTAVTNGSATLSAYHSATHTVSVSTKPDDVSEGDETITLDASGPNGLKASGTGTITNVAPTTTSTTAPPAPTTETTRPPATTTTTTRPTLELTVSSPSATEGSDLNFTVTLSGTSGLVSLDVRPVSASASNPGRDYEPPSVSSLSRNIAGASGGRFTFSVKTIRDTVEEGRKRLSCTLR